MFSPTVYWLLDLAIGFGLPVVVHAAHRAGRVSGRTVRLFWLGCALGLLWELPIFVLSALDVGSPLIVWPVAPPAPWWVVLIAHTLWDGGLFLAGVALLRVLPGRGPAESAVRPWRWPDLLVLVAWGQVSALLVEVSAVTHDAWVYVQGHPWNPTLLVLDGHALTMLPQAIWLVAPVVFWGVVVSWEGRGGVL